MDRCTRVVGLRFHPSDQELIGHFLFIKNNPNSVPEMRSSFLREFDMYGEVEPWTIWEANGGPLLDDQDLFFFTRLKKHKNRINRRIGSGTWSQGENYKPVYAKNNQETPIGKKTKLRYENKEVPEQSGCWFMDEYSAVDDGDYVICRLRENPSKRPSPPSSKPSDKKRKCQHDPEPSKKPKSTTNEARKTVSLNQRPNPETQFDTMEMFHHDQEYETQQYLLLEGTGLEEVQRDVLAPAVSEQQHTCSSSFALLNTTNDVFGSENDSGNAQLEDTDWLGDALEDVEGDSLFPALSEQQTSFMSQMQDIPSQENIIESHIQSPHLPPIGSESQQPADQTGLVISDPQVSTNEEFSFAYDNFSVPMDPAYNINSDEFSNYNFGDEFLSGGDDIGTADILQGSISFSELLEDQNHEV
uniref:NAC domain-containing protein 7-like n=1 Tax=Fragaria vesca subsp. vesca TaxID=101020 RepID=UPI0005CA7126|nr:PREDICTED: NAC domain-containing protein 7-like [Fragaria vesca subsp. vesca]